MNFKRLKTKLSMFLLGISLVPNLIISTPAFAQEYCKIEPVKRTLFSHPVANLDRQIELAMRSAELEGEVQQILWAVGLQAYEFVGGKAQIYRGKAEGRRQEAEGFCCLPSDRDQREQGFKTPTERKFSGSKSGGV